MLMKFKKESWSQEERIFILVFVQRQSFCLPPLVSGFAFLLWPCFLGQIARAVPGQGKRRGATRVHLEFPRNHTVSRNECPQGPGGTWRLSLLSQQAITSPASRPSLAIILVHSALLCRGSWCYTVSKQTIAKQSPQVFKLQISIWIP